MTEQAIDAGELTAEQRATLLRVLDWGVESRNMTYETALQVLSIVDGHRPTQLGTTRAE